VCSANVGLLLQICMSYSAFMDSCSDPQLSGSSILSYMIGFNKGLEDSVSCEVLIYLLLVFKLHLERALCNLDAKFRCCC